MAASLDSAAEKRVMLKCGCAANAICNAKGGVKYDPPIPSCVVHDCIEQVEAPILQGRMAACGCGNQRPSSLDLAFFEYRGAGSPAATHQCKECRYFDVAHQKPLPKHLVGKCDHKFIPHGAWDTDVYYCGCRGWD